jgi:uridine phosphorylase
VPVPHFDGKHLHEALYQPADVLSRWALTEPLPPAPEGVIFCWDRRLLRWLEEGGEAVRVEWQHMLQGQVYRLPNGVAAVYLIGWGAPSAAYVFELLIALGTRRFVIAGTAGGLGPTLRMGDVVVCDRAIRDEGVSHHYLEPGKYSYPSAALSMELGRALQNTSVPFRIGSSWTIDALFRETAAEARFHAADGALTVEMEAAALFAIAQGRQVDIAAALVLSDLLLDDRHVPPEPEVYSTHLQAVFRAALAALSAGVGLG